MTERRLPDLFFFDREEVCRMTDAKAQFERLEPHLGLERSQIGPIMRREMVSDAGKTGIWPARATPGSADVEMAD
jgi:hypothetical protein